jgi:hypothetical protein
MKGMFEGRKLIIATKHHKELVLGPLFEEALQVQVAISEKLDTDLLGTFSGEVERTGDPLSVARKKCEMAMHLSGCDLSLSSEGSFGAHPSAFFLPANEEWLLFSDKKNGLEIHARHLSVETNFGGEEFQSMEELTGFAQKALFPSHGLILRPGADRTDELVKGIRDHKLLEEHAAFFLKKYGKAYVETDMRAFMNPSRMKVIGETAIKLLEKIRSCCPSCQMPGFAVTAVIQGLPCQWCGTPSRSPLAHEKTCAHCAFTEQIMHPQGKSSEDPMYCDHCNP